MKCTVGVSVEWGRKRRNKILPILQNRCYMSDHYFAVLVVTVRVLGAPDRCQLGKAEGSEAIRNSYSGVSIILNRICTLISTNSEILGEEILHRGARTFLREKDRTMSNEYSAEILWLTGPNGTYQGHIHFYSSLHFKSQYLWFKNLIFFIFQCLSMRVVWIKTLFKKMKGNRIDKGKEGVGYTRRTCLMETTLLSTINTLRNVDFLLDE